MDKSTVMKNYRFLALMLFAMVAGCVAGSFLNLVTLSSPPAPCSSI